MRRRKLDGPTAQAVCEATGVHNAVEGAVMLAERFTTECGVEGAARHLDLLASFQDAKIERCAMQEAGQLVPNFGSEPQFLIFVNQDHPRRRQSFSACHELAHLLMPNYDPFHGRRVDWDMMRWNEEAEEELLCDVAAAEMLLPRRVFKPRLRACGICIEALRELSEEFDSSLEATALGIVRADLDDVAVVVWEPGYNKKDAISAATPSLFGAEDGEHCAPVEKRFRVKFGFGGGAMHDIFFPKNKSVPNDSLIALAAQQFMEGRTPHTYGVQRLTCGDGERDFYVESHAYQTIKDGQSVAKVVSLAFLNEPQREA